MPVVNITAFWLGKVKTPSQGREEWFDETLSGFGLRVSFSGKKTWFVMYRIEGDRRKRRLILGGYPQLTLGTARDKAKEALLRASRGEDPGEEKAKRKASPTVQELAEEYLEIYAKVQKRTWKNDAWIINHDLVPAWGGRKAEAIRRKDVIALLDDIAKRGAPIQANRTLACVRKMYNWAISRDILENNPCIQVQPVARENQRDRVLAEDEIKAVWKVIESLNPLMSSLYKLRLLTAQRGGEICLMRWQDLDLVGGWWTIPAEHAKNKHSHRVPLSGPTLKLIRRLQEKVGTMEWVFPSKREGQPIKDTRRAIEAIRKKTGIDFIPHDLRRTVASHMASMGIPRLVISKVLNHAEAGVTSIYDRHSYDPEKREALDAWARRLGEIIEGEIH